MVRAILLCVLAVSLSLFASQPAPASCIAAKMASICAGKVERGCASCPKTTGNLPGCCAAAASPLFFAPVSSVLASLREPCGQLSVEDFYGLVRDEAPPSPPPKTA